MRTATTILAAGACAAMLALVAPAQAGEDVIEHEKTESMHVETAPAAPVVREHERVIERQEAPAAGIVHESSKTVVKDNDNGGDDDNDND